jgi:hypothetical protein
MIYDLDFSPDGKTLAIAVWERDGGYGKHMIAFWDWPRGRKNGFDFTCRRCEIRISFVSIQNNSPLPSSPAGPKCIR